jgi:hypothetical protein
LQPIVSTDAGIEKHPVSRTLLLMTRRTPQPSSLLVPDAPRNSCRSTALAAHAETGDRVAITGNRLPLPNVRRADTTTIRR